MDHCCKVSRLSGEYVLQHGVEGRSFVCYLTDRWLGRRDYTALADEEESAALLDALKSDGINGRKLQRESVSATTLYRHFTDCFDESKSSGNTTDDTESNWESDKVDSARDVFHQNVSDSLRSLSNKGRLPEAERAQIKTEVILGCPECATQISFKRAVDRGYICAEHLSSPDSDAESTQVRYRNSPIRS